jgi:DNA polymerase-3 subunit beta
VPGPIAVPRPAAVAATEFIVDRIELLSELSVALTAVERKTTIPMLSNFLLVASQGRLTISATDLDSSMRSSCNARVKQEGACTIPARRFYDYIRLLPEGEISIKLLDNYWVQIRAGRSRTKMVGMDRGNFPQIPAFPTWAALAIPCALMRNLITQTLFAVSAEESRYTLNASLLVLSATTVSMVATDGHRLAQVENHNTPLSSLTEEKRVLIPRKALNDLSALLAAAKEETVEFADDGQTLFFRVGGRVLTSRRLTGQFPNYANVIPRDNRKCVIVRATELLASIQRVAQFADERSNAIKMRLDANLLSLSAKSTESGESEDTIETPYAGEPVTIGFNSGYIVDFLKALGNQGEVRIELKDGTSAAIMRPEGGDSSTDFKLVLMPLRV